MPVTALLSLSFNVNVVVVIVDESIVSLNVAVIDVLKVTPVNELVDETVGGVVLTFVLGHLGGFYFFFPVYPGFLKKIFWVFPNFFFGRDRDSAGNKNST